MGDAGRHRFLAGGRFIHAMANLRQRSLHDLAHFCSVFNQNNQGQ
jgi:hypothetical protein